MEILEDYGIGSVTQSADGRTFFIGARKEENIKLLLEQLKVRNRSRKHHKIMKMPSGYHVGITAHEMLAILTTYSFLPDLDEFDNED